MELNALSATLNPISSIQKSLYGSPFQSIPFPKFWMESKDGVKTGAGHTGSSWMLPFRGGLFLWRGFFQANQNKNDPFSKIFLTR